MDPSADEVAREILDIVPLIMRTIRGEMRSQRGPDLTVPQYRAMLFIRTNPGASLSGVAEHLGLTLPSTSKLIDGLVERGFITRQGSTKDRRRINLELTAKGEPILEESYQHTRARLGSMISNLSEDEHRQVLAALRTLQPIFSHRAVEENKSLLPG